MQFGKGITGVLDEGGVLGFFTLELAEGHAHLRHLCVRRGARTPGRALALIRAARRVVLAVGQSQMLVHAKGERLNRLVRWYFHATPYKQADDGAMLYQVRA
ncbi:MAG: hypothetical protein ACE5JS_21330 [Nitrospinota bacterium]